MIEIEFIGADDTTRHDDRPLKTGDRISVSHIDAEAMIATGLFALAAPAPHEED